tara:strand:- start:623 stop:2020 length:1398 start_codon:yes stop_codon:yes gene_type:complete
MTIKHLIKFLLFVVLDIVIILSTIFFGFIFYIYSINNSYELSKIYDYLPLVLFSPIIHFLFGLYKNVCYSIINDSKKMFFSIITTFAFFATVMFLSKDGIEFSRLVYLFSLVFSVVIFPFYRYFLRLFLGKFDFFRSNVIIFGTGKTAHKMYDILDLNRHIGLKPVLLVDDSIPLEKHESANYASGLMSAAKYIDQYNVRFGILAMPSISNSKTQNIIDFYADKFIQFIIIPNFYNISSLWIDSIDFSGQIGLQIRHKLIIRRYILLKKTFDLLATCIGGFIFLPLFFLIYIIIRLSSKGPVIYSQLRCGFGGEMFKTYKFRTMIENADEKLKHYLSNNPDIKKEWDNNQKLKHDPRVTLIGKFLRATSLDELPQLINVLKGEMSLVGPRPIVESEIQKYDKNYELYKRVKPGMTGLWQVSGRNNTTYKERVEFDCYYVRNWSFSLDVYILLRTIRVVLFRHGAY